MSAAKRYTAAGEGVVRTDPDGALVSFEDYAAIHYERIHDLNQIGGLQEENARLQAEVERLSKAVMHSPAAQLKLKELEGKTTFEEINPKDDNSNITTELLVLCNRQASDIRRLTKAGDEMAEEIALAKRQDEGSRFDPIEMHYNHELIVKWLAAKEGKPRA